MNIFIISIFFIFSFAAPRPQSAVANTVKYAVTAILVDNNTIKQTITNLIDLSKSIGFNIAANA